jgi:hypothetical protein
MRAVIDQLRKMVPGEGRCNSPVHVGKYQVGSPAETNRPAALRLVQVSSPAQTEQAPQEAAVL